MPLDLGPMRAFVRRVHFVGVGGVGMSGIAEVLSNLGYRVSGSDLKASAITRRLQAAGVRLSAGHRAAHIRGAQVVVVSSAVRADNPEVLAARRAGVPVVLRAQMLAELGRMKKTVTVAGSHGKTTTTAMAAMALAAAGARPTMIVGGQIKNIGSNARLGLGDYLVTEADESDGSFVHLSPLVAVVTNIDNDHLDHHKTMANLRAAFAEHLARLPFYGAAVLCADDPELARLRPSLGARVITYGIARRADWQARSLRLGRDGSSYEACYLGRRVARIRLRVPGRHNVLNSLAALAAGRFLGLALSRLGRGLSAFRGVGRRLDRLGAAGSVEFVDDYGHHPTEVRAAVEAVARLWRCRRTVVVFQPHRYSRTQLLARQFGPAFRQADLVFVMDVYPAGEAPIPGVSSALILDSLRRSGVACAPFTGSLDVLRQLRPGDAVLTLGAGDVWKTGMDLLRRLETDLASPV
ncbi:MAG: UDP-N-acetylmuramate--L-alanine ligase [Elusimicrobia bacterium]|nr:UDP-N-acetylmuramate--L-alanine ligase [Elusimicrobiota bacterium]